MREVVYNAPMSGISRRSWWALAFLVLAQFMLVLDVSIMNVALPSIQQDYHFTETGVQWIVTAYTLAFGSFLLFGGRTADLYGRRRVFLVGLAAFTGVSLLIGILNSAQLLIPLRALQGFAGAFMSAAALSLVLTLFETPEGRTRSLAIWSAVSAGGATAGLILGGFLTQYLGWRWNFFINVPLGILVFAGVWQLIPRHLEQSKSRSLDVLGAALVTGGLLALVYAVSETSSWGWFSTPTLGLFALSIVLLAGFVYNESRLQHPLLPLRILTRGNIAAADLIQLPMTASLFTMFFFISLYLQNVLGYAPFIAGLAFLPATATIMTGAIVSPRVIKAIGYKPLLISGPLSTMLGLLYFAQIPVHGTYLLNVLPGLLLCAVGLGLTFTAISLAATDGVPGHESGVVSGLLNTARRLGGSIGLAILTSAATAGTAVAAASGSAPQSALVSGFHAAFYVGAGFASLASLIAALFVRSIPTEGVGRD